MKVLIVHNFYQSTSPSGEDVVFRNEVELLRKNGVEVITYTRHNDEILSYGLWDKVFLPLDNIWSKRSYKEIKELIQKEKPDLAHFHNIWYLISPSAYYACKAMKVPIVQTLYNFRIFCTNGLLIRNGKICEECIRVKKGHGVMGNRFKIIKNAFKYGCYRNSRLYSTPIALAQYFHWIKRTWVEKIDAYIALTEFARRKFIEGGLPEEKIFVKPIFLPSPSEPSYSLSDFALFIGRLSVEKGLDILIEAFKYLSREDRLNLKIIGYGTLKIELENKVRSKNIKNIDFMGKRRHEEIIEALKNSKFLILPSICYEMFPLVLEEAFSCGKPVIASNLGALAELVEDGKTGLLFEPGNPEDLARKIKWMIDHEDECIKMGKNARRVFEEKYRTERNFEILMEIYERVIKGKG